MSPQEIASLVDALAGPLVLYARQWCGCPEDVVQEAFLKLAGRRRPPDDVRAWLFRVTRNAALDAGKASRRRRVREAAASQTDWFAEPAVDGLVAAEAVAALTELPGGQREVIVARLWGGLTLGQAAVAAGCSTSAAHRRYEAGLRALRQRLGGS